MSTPADRSNRIEVDLRLLQDENLNLLNEFGNKFAKAVEDLEAVAERIFGISGVPIAEVRETASTPDAVQRVISGPLGQPTPSVLNQVATVPATPQESESRARIPGPDWRPANKIEKMLSYSYAPLPGEYGGNEFERAQLSLGMLTPGFISGLQYISFMAGRHYAKVEDPTRWDPETGRYLGGRLPPIITGAAGGVARGLIYGRQFLNKLNYLPLGLSPMAMNRMTMVGISTGDYDTAGFFGTPYGSRAWRRGIRQEWDAWLRSRWGSGINWNPITGFGLFDDPNYTREQAREAQRLMTDYGWGGDLRDVGLDIMQRYTQRYRGALSQDFMMQLIDPIMRYGGGSISQVTTTLNALAQSAKAANMNLQLFSERALQAGQAISQQTGMPINRATRAAGNIMGITGLSGEAVTTIMTDPTYMWLAAAESGQGIGSVIYGSEAASLRTKAMLDFADPGRQGIGNVERWRGFKWNRPYEEQSPEHQALIDEFVYKQLSGQIPQNIDFNQWANMMRRSLITGQDPVDAISAVARIDEAIEKSQRKGTAQAGVRIIGETMRDLGFGREWKAALELERMGVNINDISDQEREQAAHLLEIVKPYWDLIKERGGSIDTLEDAQAFARGIGTREWDLAAGDIAQQSIEITVKPPYGEIFEAYIKRAKNTSTRNSSGWFARKPGSINLYG